MKRTIGRRELRDALAFGAAILVVGASFGALAAAAGVPPELIVGLSVLVFAGGSQFLVVAVVAAGGSPLAAVLAGLLLNARHLPFGLAMADVVGTGRLARLVGAHILVDESVAFAKARGGGPAARSLYWLIGGTAFVSWNLGTVAGMIGGAAVPDPAAFGVDAAFPAGLLALLLPSLRRADARRVGLAAAVLALLAVPVLPPGLPVLIGLAGLLAAGRAPTTGSKGAPAPAPPPDEVGPDNRSSGPPFDGDPAGDPAGDPDGRRAGEPPPASTDRTPGERR